MSFWTTSDGAAVDTANKEYETAGGGVLIPDNSSVLAFIKDAGIKQDVNFNSYYFIDWTAMKPEPVEGAFIRQKLWLIDDDPQAKDPKKKRDNGLRMLGAIDANCGGKLATLKAAPTDEQMKIALVNKQLVIRTKVWEMNGSEGNWVAGVFAKTAPVELKGEVKAKASAPAKTAEKSDDGWGAAGGGFGDDLEDSIPFD